MRTNILSSILFVGASLMACVSVGCAADSENNASEPEVTGTTASISFDAWEKTVAREDETGNYIVNGDQVLTSRDELRSFYEEYVQQGDLIVHRANGADAKWNNTQKLNITYCVSRASFGSRYNTVVNAMNSATAAWEGVAKVNFVHSSGQDGNCTASNTNVVFDVNQTSTTSYLARAFFPNNGRSSRNVLISTSAFGNTAPYTLAGILRHELGHTLGFRHEHTRPESGTCFEDNSWRALTTYDSASVMHYPQCNGSNRGDLVLTTRDRQGAAALYGAP
ncbi:M57 family metalloprotease [Pendulispora brunnea]|uniref:M57 family metalloprotease n=1 Tax=Pendulispora brunnea TaxID=2905690 RepID=A0ABZ2K021_9BACT